MAVTPSNAPILYIDSLDMDGRGIARIETNRINTPSRKVIFVDGALPGEYVTYSSYSYKLNFEQATVIDILRPSVMRQQPKCTFFGKCGGCSMQHLNMRAQVAIKQRALEDNLWHLAKIRPETIFSPIYGPSWEYRHRARLTVRNVNKKGGVLIGFHEKKSSYVTDMTHCEILPKNISAILIPLRLLIRRLSIYNRIPQIELAIGSIVTALVLRVLEPINDIDKTLLQEFAEKYKVQFWLQPNGPDTIIPLYRINSELDYTLPEFNIRILFKPTDFTQINHQINRVLVGRALDLLVPSRSDRILDLFCGIGNFTLPLARLAKQVIGIDGNNILSVRALENAQKNDVDDRVTFKCWNLFKVKADDIRSLGVFNQFLIDPPREGAIAVSKALVEIAHSADKCKLPNRIVYISCNPSTFARDASLLVHKVGYRLKGVGIINMFPHTSHTESISLFERD
ncbi:MAG: 23S rRNA (uracil(1939)-C(5))-methyltransferase RlmD [Burkholderia sp.]|nr:23S rRNA (uracil(1939)-C(5))-methyltransferase RlmD [Burkholderia sp.]